MGKRMPKIAFVHAVNVLGGAERMSEALIRGLTPEKYRFALISPEKGQLSDTFQHLDSSLFFNSFHQPSIRSPFKSINNVFGWRHCLKSADIIHTGDLVSTRSLLWAAKLAAKPVLCHIHFPLEEPFVRWVFNFAPKPDMFVFCSNELQESTGPILKKYCKNARQVVIHNGVNTEIFKPLPRTEKATNVANIGIVANLQERKGHDDFIDMASQVYAIHPDVHFHIIGGDILQAPREPLLKQKVMEKGLQDVFTFHGQLPDVREALSKLDIYVCASHQEAFPVSILEAMACGKTIVSTNVNGIPEALQHEKNALLISPHSPDEMAEAVLRLIREPLLAQNLASQARSDVVNNFSLQRYCELFAECYSELMHA